MNSKKTNDALIKRNISPFLPSEIIQLLPPELTTRFALYPENARHPVNKTLFKNDYFQLTCNVRENSLAISSRGDLVYSAIPYDTARNYIQRGAIQYLLHPEEVRKYVVSHKKNLEKYLSLSIFQVTGKRVEADSPEVIEAYQAILDNPLLEIQILGRLLQHDETGPLSANLAGKFLFSENVKTGIAGYLAEYLNFVVQLTQSLPLMTDGKSVQLLATEAQSEGKQQQLLTFDSDISSALALLPQELQRSIVGEYQVPKVNTKPLLRSEYGAELAKVRENYIAHSVHPDELTTHFENVHETENTNLINVVSDIHATDGKLPFSNQHFNILVGDSSDSQVTDKTIRGIYLIGHHDIVDVLNEDPTAEKWQPFKNYMWFKQLLIDPDEAWYLLPTGDHAFYQVVKTELENRFPQMTVLHNSSVIHEGTRYIGLTIPVSLVDRKKEQQKFILETLQKLLAEDHQIPTVIVSHAPLFNELSMLSATSEAYNQDYTCSDPAIEQLFADYRIIGAIHGHHHIPASSGRYKIVKFADKDLFVVCSIYSKMNTGFELKNLLASKLFK
ncbi:metallophosphoesterase [Enterococcus sp. ALS3]|uniref:Metallophosphoesterase n=1 Tax=Enterococcus alishanensis TaxID=1303817 RepID=A0ABS6TGD3_9ENTE|nr:metallophosphoesterase [Enterococcus alishanensis]MBV7391933.1 metallophosphoesterase [Enterococcus alishanensis]